MIWTIVIVLLVYMFIRFGLDTKKQSDEIKEQGGLESKYQKLVSLITEEYQTTRVSQKTNTFLCIETATMVGVTSFSFYPTYGNLTIRLNVQGHPIYGYFKLEWTFPESMSQEHMFINIKQDFDNKITQLNNTI